MAPKFRDVMRELLTRVFVVMAIWAFGLWVFFMHMKAAAE